MSAEDELTSYREHPPLVARDVAEFAEYWDDSKSPDWNIQAIGWWLRQQIDDTK
jgi:hypothetical protein